MFERLTLSGHREVVNCFDQQPSSGLLISGSSDRTIRLWDLKSCRSSKCIAGCFDTAVVSTRMAHKTEHILVAGTESSVYTFDLRFDGILQKQAISQIIEGSFDDINVVAVSPKDDTVAVADDTGTIKLIPLSNTGDQNKLYIKSKCVFSTYALFYITFRGTWFITKHKYNFFNCCTVQKTCAWTF